MKSRRAILGQAPAFRAGKTLPCTASATVSLHSGMSSCWSDTNLFTFLRKTLY